MLKWLLGLLMVSATVADAAPIRRLPGVPTVQALYGRWRIIGVAVPRDGVQALATNDPNYVGQRLTFTHARLSWDTPNPSYGGTPCVAPAIRPVRPGRGGDERIAKIRGQIVGAFAVGCKGGAWGPAAPPAPEIMALRDGTIALWWFDGALLTLRRVG